MSRLDRFVETTGFTSLQKTLNNLAYKDKKAILMPALRRAVQPTQALAKSNAPVGKTGNLRKSIGVISLSQEIAVIVGARIKGGYKGYHGHLVDEGTVDRFRKSKKNAPTGKMSTTKSYFHFFTRAAQATEKQAIDSLANDWRKSVAMMIIRDNKKDQ